MATWRWARVAAFGACAAFLLTACANQIGKARPERESAAGTAASVAEVQTAVVDVPAPAEPEAAPQAVREAAADMAAAAEEPAAPVEEAAAPAKVTYAEMAVEPASAPAPAAAPAAPAPAVPAGPLFLTAVDVSPAADGLFVFLRGSGPLNFEYFLVEGRSLVVDIAGAANKVWPAVRKVGGDYVTQIRIGEHDAPAKRTRVVFDLKRLAEYRVAAAGEGITVTFGAPALAAAPEAPAEAAGSTMALNTVSEVSYRPLEGRSRIEVHTAVAPEFSVLDSGDPAKIVLEIANARIEPRNQKVLDLTPLEREVVRLAAYPYEQEGRHAVRVTVQLREPLPFHAAVTDGRVVLEVERTPAAAAQEAPAAGMAEEAPAAAAEAMAEAAPAQAAAGEDAAAEAPKYSGRRLSLDFKDADVNDILRLISEVSGLNFVAGKEVTGTVTIKLQDVPWDQALDIILRTNRPMLAQIRESENIVRITTADQILDEEQRRRRLEEDKKKTIDAQRQLEPLETRIYNLNYTKASVIADLIQNSNVMSERGRVYAEPDGYTLTVTDIKAKLEEIEAKVVREMDGVTPAVVVEARIVEVTSGFDQQVGVQWNVAGVKDAAHGNATSYAFPNSIAVGGTQGDGSGQNYMVNLPAAASTAGIGFSFGHVANTLSLDLKLSAMEKLGKTKILSNPKVLVIQNQKAIINVGSQLPIPKTDAEGNRTVEWKDVGIKLEVQPQIIPGDKTVFMDIQIEKSAQGENVQTTEGAMFSIVTSRAQTKVLIKDGETTVIGGIFVQENISDDAGVPGFSRIPILGWLFKNKSQTERKRELMIFLTPRLVTI